MRHGFLLIDKPEGPTSHDVVAAVRQSLGERSVGHLGTLDPAATGLLVLAVGRKALKVVSLFQGLDKEYEAEVTLGATSSTYDREGVIERVLPQMGWQPPDQVVIQRLLADRFTGKIAQAPPGYSAVHVSGERAYRKMRQGRAVALPPRDVTIHRIQILSYEFPRLRLLVACGSGTYIRSLAHDLGDLLRCGGYLSALRRTRVGEWSLADAVSPERAAWGHVRPLRDVLAHIPRRDLLPDEWEDLRFGRDIEAEVAGPVTVGWFEDLPVALLEPRGEGVAHASKVF